GRRGPAAPVSPARRSRTPSARRTSGEAAPPGRPGDRAPRGRDPAAARRAGADPRARRRPPEPGAPARLHRAGGAPRPRRPAPDPGGGAGRPRPAGDARVRRPAPDPDAATGLRRPRVVPGARRSRPEPGSTAGPRTREEPRAPRPAADRIPDDATEGIAPEEYRARVERVRGAVEAAGLAGLIAFGDCWRGANVGYFTGFRPLDGVSDIASALVVLPAAGEPTLVVSEQCLGYAASVTGFPVRPFRELGAVLAPLGRRGRVGLAGSAYLPAPLRDRLGAGLGPATLEATAVLADLKAVKSPAELRLLRRAAALTDLAMATIRDVLADGRPHTERELARRADAAMLAAGAERPAYDSMVQAGPRSAWNLARPPHRLLAPGDLVMTDIGARYRGYVADGGRGFTYGPVDAERRAIVEAAASAVEAGLA